jgi:class 3 adenylate cyclase
LAFGGRVEAERRQVTVLFTDMVGFTSFSERSGEEAAYTLMRSLSKLMDEAVREHRPPHRAPIEGALRADPP